MAFSGTYNYSERCIFDIKTFVEALRLLIVNSILGVILLFLTLEEIDWKILTSRKQIKDIVVDKTLWNMKSIFKISLNS